VSHHASPPSIPAVPSRSDPPSRRVSVAGEASNAFAEFVTMDRDRETASKPEPSHAGPGSADRRNASREPRRSADDAAPARPRPVSDRTVAHDSIPRSPDACDRAAATRGPDDAETEQTDPSPRRNGAEPAMPAAGLIGVAPAPDAAESGLKDGDAVLAPAVVAATDPATAPDSAGLKAGPLPTNAPTDSASVASGAAASLPIAPVAVAISDGAQAGPGQGAAAPASAHTRRRIC